MPINFIRRHHIPPLRVASSFCVDMATGVATVQPMSGDALHLREGAQASQEVFQRDVRSWDPIYSFTLHPSCWIRFWSNLRVYRPISDQLKAMNMDAEGQIGVLK